MSLFSLFFHLDGYNLIKMEHFHSWKALVIEQRSKIMREKY